MLMRRNVAAGIGSNEQGEYCRAALQRSDRKEPRYKWPTLLFLTRKLQDGGRISEVVITLRWKNDIKVISAAVVMFHGTSDQLPPLSTLSNFRQQYQVQTGSRNGT